MWWLGRTPQPPHIWFCSSGQAVSHHPASVPFRKFDEEVLRTLRGLRPHPLPADTAVSGGEALRSLHCAARSAVQVSLRAAARGSGVGVEDDHGRSACSRGAAVKLHVESTSRS